MRGLPGPRFLCSRASASHFGGRPRRLPRPRARRSKLAMASMMFARSSRSSDRILFTSTVWLPLVWNHTVRATYDERQSPARARTVWFDEATVGVLAPSVAATSINPSRPVMCNIFGAVSPVSSKAEEFPSRRSLSYSSSLPSGGSCQLSAGFVGCVVVK